MAVPVPPPPAPPPPYGAPVDDSTPRWGLGDAAAGWFVAYAAAAVVGVAVVALAGYKATDDIPLAVQVLLQVPLWAGFIGVPVWAAATKGNGWVRDFRGTFRGVDVLIGIPAGIAAQLILVPLVSAPVLWLADKSTDDLSAPAQELTDRAGGGIGIVLLVLLVGFGAPIAEELFFRGLVLGSFEKRFAPVAALVLSSLVFAATHFQPLQFAGLFAAGMVFGGLVQRTGRLGTAVVAHLAFNLTSITILLALS